MSSGSSLPAILLTSYEKSEGPEGGQCFFCALSRSDPALSLTWLGSSEEVVVGARPCRSRMVGVSQTKAFSSCTFIGLSF